MPAWNGFLEKGFTALAALGASVVIFILGLKQSFGSTASTLIWSGLFLFLTGFSIYTAVKKSVKGLFGLGVALTVLVSLVVRPSLDMMLGYSYSPDAKTLRNVRQIEAIQDLPFFALETLNPKEIWDVGKISRHWDVVNDPRPKDGSPLVLLTTRAPADVLPLDLQKLLTMTSIGKFNYDPRKLSKFIYLTLIRFP